MKNLGIITITLGIGIMALAGNALADTARYRVHGDSASGSMYYYDGCTSRALDIHAARGTIHVTGESVTRSSGIWLGFWSFNWCDGSIASGWSFVPEADVRVSMSSARAQAALPVDMYRMELSSDGYWEYILIGTEVMNVDVSWTGTGEVYAGTYASSSRWGKFMYRYRAMGRSRDAELTAAIELGGAPLAFQDSYGNLGTYHNSEMSISPF